MTVTENRGDFWIKNSQNYLKRLFPNAPRQQQLRKPLFEENSAVYGTYINYLLKNKKIFCNNMGFVKISKIEGFDINNKEDLKIAKALVGMNKKIS
jgi:CMP-N-acetylneuraminic acid synthetase